LLVDLILGSGHSLKEKRSVLLSLIKKLQNQFNISIAEVNYQDLWQRSQLAVVCVNTEWQAVERILQRIVAVIQSDPRCTLLNSEFRKIY